MGTGSRSSGRWRSGGVLATVISGGRARFVTHYGIEEGDVEEALNRVEAALSSTAVAG